ncbi:MAG: prepilin peptidase [Elusimicrobia bacterium]|nr:prepilin peptidase [Elusimicrobiota bacterium]
MIGFLAFWLGACAGSFVNVVAWRMPREESVVFPRSRCPSCRAPIAWFDNIPILSWLLLRGRCRRCGGAISMRYPLVEGLMACLSLALWLRWQGSPLWSALAAAAAADLLAIALIDWDTGFIPAALSIGLVVAGVAAAPFNPLLRRGTWPAAVGGAALGAATGFLLCWLTAEAGKRVFKKEAMGGGDLILLAGIGAWSGGVGAFDSLMLGSLLGAGYGVGLVARGRPRLADPVPFGPFLAAGAAFNFFCLLPLGWPFLTIR